MRKTAITELIEHFEKRKLGLANTDGERFIFDFCIASLKKKLETEREQIEDAYDCGHMQGSDRGLGDVFEAEQHYKETYG